MDVWAADPNATRLVGLQYFGDVVNRRVAGNVSISAYCDLCGKTKEQGGRIVIEHCHRHNRVRGWACANCNGTLGHIIDSGRYKHGVIAPRTEKRMVQFLEWQNRCNECAASAIEQYRYAPLGVPQCRCKECRGARGIIIAELDLRYALTCRVVQHDVILVTVNDKMSVSAKAERNENGPVVATMGTTRARPIADYSRRRRGAETIEQILARKGCPRCEWQFNSKRFPALPSPFA